MSGYDQGVIGAQRLINEGDVLIQKPFTAHTLLERVGRVLATASHDRTPPTKRQPR
jgi:hypothetical protein